MLLRWMRMSDALEKWDLLPDMFLLLIFYFIGCLFFCFFFLVIIAHFPIHIPQPTGNCMSYKERPEPHCTLSPSEIPS